MDFHTLSRRQLQALCKRNKIPANITNVAMADSLHALEFVEGIEEIINSSESEIAQSPMVPPTGGRSRAVKLVQTPGAAPATSTRATSVRRNIEVSSLDEVEEVNRDVFVKTPAAVPASRRRAVRETSTVKPVYSTRRSARLAVKVEEPKETSQAIKINSFTEEIDENVELQMEGGSVDRSENSEITTVLEENEVKSNDESEAISEETSDNQNGGDVADAIIEQTINGSMEVSENVCGLETEGTIEETKMYSIVAQETKASIEDTEMNSNEDLEVKASFEVTDVISDLDEEAKTVVEDTKMNCNVDEEPKVPFEDTEIKANVDAKEEEEIDIADSKGHMVANVTVDVQDSDMFDNDQEEMIVSEVEKQDELVDDKDNLDSKFSAGGDVHMEPLNNFAAAGKTPKTVGRLLQTADDKENVDSGRKSILVKQVKKKQFEDCSIRQLIKEIKKLEISKQQKKEKEEGKGEDIVKATTRPALKTLSENMMVVESHD